LEISRNRMWLLQRLQAKIGNREHTRFRANPTIILLAV
jgi:hypothetical protein